ncbi:MAG: hypothetical protein WCT03_16800 [Candidatus Obscuribacterales bacterium]|jgi:hypothetical protein
MKNRKKLLMVALLTSGLATEFAMASSKTPSRKYRESRAYMPTGLDDPRLTENTFYAKGTDKYQEGIKSRYSDELCRYARKLYSERKYYKALQVINLSIENQPKINLGEPDHLRIYILLAYAGSIDKIKAQPYYEKAITECDKGLKGWHALDFYLPKIDALIGLDRKDDAIRCCETAYNAALGASRDVSVYAATLAKLNGSSRPASNLVAVAPSADKAKNKSSDTTSTANNLTKDNIVRIQKEVTDMVKHDTCPTQKEIENLLGAKFEVQFPDEPNLIRRGIPQGNDLYRHVDLRIPHIISSPSNLILDLRPEAAAINENMVRSWFGNLEPICEKHSLTSSLIYEYPWGEVEISFSPFEAKTAYSIIYRWAKSSECDGLVSPQDGPQPSLEDRLKDIDDRYNKGEKKSAFKELYWNIAALVPGISSTEAAKRREAVRERLIKWKENEMKPEIVAYLRTAPYRELEESMEDIIFCTRADFFTLKEYEKFSYRLMGEMDESFNGHCSLEGSTRGRVIAIEEKTEAAKRFFDVYKIKLPFKAYSDDPRYISPLNGPLIDQIEEEQNAVVAQRVKERTELEKAKYLEDSKNPEIVKQRIIDARRDALDPHRATTREVYSEFYKRQK